jgi:hypothetical protein
MPSKGVSLLDNDKNTSLYGELTCFFEEANKRLLFSDGGLLLMRVSERTLCGALMLHLHEVLKNTRFKDYHVDVEYNRNKGGKLKTYKKTITGDDYQIITINCDLIVHSRGNIVARDNLIAVEMKKSSQSQRTKGKDRERLEALTKNSFDDIWSFDGKTLPEHVCRYALGIYYEINFAKNEALIEYYKNGCMEEQRIIRLGAS